MGALKNFLRVSAGIVVSALCAVGCMSSSDDDDDDSIARENIASAYANGMCNALAECCQGLGQPMNTAACIEQVEGNYAKSNDPGLIYDGNAAGECLAAGTAAYRQCRSVEAPVCARVWTGYLEDGELCGEDPRACKGGSCTNDPTGALCTTPVLSALGEPCEANCVDGAYCDAGSQTCLATKPNGAACVDDLECTGNYCNFSSGQCDESAIFATLCSAFGGSTITEPFCCALDELCASCDCADSNASIASSNDGAACQFVLEGNELGCASMSEDEALAFCL